MFNLKKSGKILTKINFHCNANRQTGFDDFSQSKERCAKNLVTIATCCMHLIACTLLVSPVTSATPATATSPSTAVSLRCEGMKCIRGVSQSKIEQNCLICYPIVSITLISRRQLFQIITQCGHLLVVNYQYCQADSHHDPVDLKQTSKETGDIGSG